MKRYAKLRGRMAEKNVTQEKLAKELGISKATMNNRLNGKSEFGLKELQIIFQILDLEDIESYFFEH